ncbi:uncharacterized protein LAJ45_03004 [Morchella importuna]|uniref:uncharacterized protein n=1 Tax=Morchella importuna TaxID=1174673 RepID=UPI001E8D6AC4|nr:uncharacterized protein LAJ45_03004 [Morchella importuna]KAH8152779.1 hypothetical protein LAJ45_03004 [Morchella importuna]
MAEMIRTHKTPNPTDYLSYFDRVQHADWDILKYLRFCQACIGPAQLNSEVVLSAWQRQLRQRANQPDESAASRAATLLQGYSSSKDRRSDRARAKGFLRRGNKPIRARSTVSLHVAGDNYGTIVATDANVSVGGLPGGGPNKQPINGPRKLLNNVTFDDYSEFESSDEEQNEASDEETLDDYDDMEELGSDSEYMTDSSEPDNSKEGELKKIDLLELLTSKGFTPDVLREYYPLPKFPKHLTAHLAQYEKVSTVAECRKLSYPLEVEWESADKDLLSCKYWIDIATETLMSLITESHGLLRQQDLGQGVWDGICWIVLDLAFTSLPSLMLQRRNLEHYSISVDPIPLCLTPRFDGIIRTRVSSIHPDPRLEYAVLQTSKNPGFNSSDSVRWNTDIGKLHAACRSMLRNLKSEVSYDEATIKKLAVVGILQSGPNFMFLVMSCIGRKLYYLRRGETLRLPTEVEQFQDMAPILTNIWKAVLPAAGVDSETF